jgi:tetratricopeptide (TPR) repeat protein
VNGRTEHPDYELLERCGQGGMGVVYRARDRRLNRIVALKFLSPGEGDSAFSNALQRFQREAEAIAALNYPGIATIYELGKWDGDPFLALEFLSGGTLRDRLPARFGVAQLIDLSVQLGSALAFAHSKGVLHRDIKPANCMFTEGGILKLVDFGLAKPIGATEITQQGTTVGTIPYMAPELLRGEPATVRSDLYALGVVVYEMAAGRPLYANNGFGPLIQQILDGSATPLRQLRPDLPEALCAAVDRAVAPDPAKRFASVPEFVAELRAPGILYPAGDATPTTTMPHSAVHTAATRKWWIAGAIVALVAGLVVAAIRLFPANDTLVVLPFENLGANPANKALCDGLQETVTSLLATADELPRSLMIVPSSEVRASQIHTIADARKQFHATLAMSGSVQTGSSDLKLTLNLADARKLRQKDSQTLTIPIAETAQLQPQLKERLGVMLGAGTLLQRHHNQGETTANSAAYELFLRGRGALQDRKIDDAIQLLQQALDADPQFALARAKLAEAYMRRNLGTQDPKWLAMADTEVAKAANDGAGPEILISQALIRRAMGNWSDAIRLFRNVLKSEPANVEAYRFLAETWDSAKNQKEAEKTYREALRMRPGYWPLYDSLANFYSVHGRYNEAIQTFSAGVALAPDSPQLYYNLGANYYRMSRWADAGTAFEKSLAIRPTPIGYSNLGTVRFYQGNYAEAAKNCKSATELQPANPINWGNLGDSLWQLPGRLQDAAEAFEKAASLAAQQLAIKPDNPNLRKLYAVYLAKLGRKELALAEVARTRTQAAASGSVAFYAARVYAVLGDATDAMGELSRSLKLGYSADEIDKEPDFAEVKKDSRYGELVTASIPTK